MLNISIPATEAFDPVASEFITVREQTICIEHSLVSISKWESKWHKPYLSNEEKTPEQIYDYIKCMTITKNVDPNVYLCIPQDELKKINDYIADSMTATWFSEDQKKKHGPNRETVTAELIYYWMIAFGIPFECQKWHLNKLITLIRVCEEKNKPEKKLSKNEIYARNKALNAARRKRYNSKG